MFPLLLSRQKGFRKVRKAKKCIFKMKSLSSTAQKLEHWSYTNERLGAGETMGLAPLSLRRTRGHICYHSTEFLLELLLQLVLMWQDWTQAAPVLEIFSAKPGWRDKELVEIYFLYKKRKRGTNEISLFYQIVTIDHDSTFCVGCQEAPTWYLAISLLKWLRIFFCFYSNCAISHTPLYIAPQRKSSFSELM